MSFGESVREIMTASCGSDVRATSATTEIPELRSETAQRTLAANLELAFGIQLQQSDLAHLHTVRDVMQCVRLRAWERRTIAASDGNGAVPAREARVPRPVFVATTRDPRERFIRYTLQAAPSLAFAPVK